MVKRFLKYIRLVFSTSLIEPFALILLYGAFLFVVQGVMPEPVLDLDRFKLLNDKLGHLPADFFLQVMARALRETLRKLDIIARLGGDEFALVFPDTPPEGAVKAAEKVLKAIEGVIEENENYQGIEGLGASIGLYTTQNGSEAILDILSNADEALYAAKRQGRKRIVAWSPNLQ